MQLRQAMYTVVINAPETCSVRLSDRGFDPLGVCERERVIFTEREEPCGTRKRILGNTKS